MQLQVSYSDNENEEEVDSDDLDSEMMPHSSLLDLNAPNENVT